MDIMTWAALALAIAGAVAGLGWSLLYRKIRKASKEWQEVKMYWDKAIADGELTEIEMRRLQEEIGQAITATEDALAAAILIANGIKRILWRRL